ncbi:MAG: alpha/beta fold hydrolase [Acinetobacter sp.]|nr:alpha/beta fold hydrolase [Acinetobacter sp.]
MQNKLLAVVLTGSALVLTACGGDDNDAVYAAGDDVPKYSITDPVVTTSLYDLDDLSADAADSRLMTYKMLGVDGEITQATALVFTPKTAPPAKGWPIVVWAHGTTGVADKCAPSQQGLQATQGLLEQLLAEGYVVVAPDYEGLGTAGSHPFLNLKSEAFSITDAVMAARDYLSRQGKKVSSQWMTIGHSQGGHAALGAAQYASRVQLDYKGTIAIAPASNLEVILKGGEAAVKDQPANVQIPVLARLDMFTSLIVAGMQGHAISVNYAQVFKNDTAAIAPIAESECAKTVGDALGNGMGKYAFAHNNSLNGYGRTQDNFMTVPQIRTFLEKDSQPLRKKVSTPVIIYQGTADTTVPSPATDLLFLVGDGNGTKIKYIKDTWNHDTVYANNFDKFIQDVKTLMPLQ